MEKPKDLWAVVSGTHFKQQIGRLIPDAAALDRFLRIAQTAFLRWPDVRQCTEQSLIKCFMTLAERRIEPNGRDATVIARRNRDGVYEAHPMLMYQGRLLEARRIPGVGKIKAEVIHANDEFDWNMGEVVAHRIKNLLDRGEIIGAYAQATVGDETYCEIMTKRELEVARSKSDGWKRSGEKSAWGEWEGEMSKKSVLNRLCKWLPRPDNMPVIDDEGIIDVTTTVGPPEPATEAITAPPVEDVIDTAPASEAPSSSPQKALAMMAIEIGFDLQWFCDYARGRRMIEHPVDDWAQVPEDAAQLALDARKAIAKAWKEGRR